ncbi:flagellar brake protein [Methylococcus sp. EFPC2]|uniref:flagellar brake protein n=1 Tax=Methylococcus sp. EFPC2 TaxID=2812648 RepID=UPI0019679EFB|nr:flagellar brake protein [Methylococcus sp. EFPC2]QSA97339.1 flagellar brake protein [Methylococcus sp. EFPC2]
MPDSHPSAQSGVYTLTDRSAVLDKLRLLERRQVLLTATCAGDGSGVLVSLVRILPERGLLALDAGTERPTIERMLQAEPLVLDGLLDGIQAHFEVRGIREATLDGQDLLAAPIPESLFWLQRRNFFRAFIPYGTEVKCRVTLPDGEIHDFDVVNLSIRGIALVDKTGRLRYWGRPGQVFEDCRLDFPGFESERLDLEIRGKLETSDQDARQPTVRVGFSFRKVGPALEAKIQRLLHDLETRARKERVHLDFRGS